VAARKPSTYNIERELGMVTSIILASQEAKIRRIAIQGQKYIHKTPVSANKSWAQ
jgi:hypothetical protein